MYVGLKHFDNEDLEQSGFAITEQANQMETMDWDKYYEMEGHDTSAIDSEMNDYLDSHLGEIPDEDKH